MHLYNFVEYCSMLTDPLRLDGYVRALKEAVTPDSVVLDLGAGTGVFSILACEFGARKVCAVEVNPLVGLLWEAAAERGYKERIEIIRKDSNEIELEERANVLVSDIHGAFPLHESGLETIIDARERLLTQDAVMIPRRERIFFAVSSSEEIYEKNVRQYLADFHGFRIPSSERFVLNRWFRATDDDETLLSAPGMFADIDHRTNERTGFEEDLEFRIETGGTAHGLRGWFESELSPDNRVSNAIGIEETTYARPFFPFERPVEVAEGDLVRVSLAARYEKGNYVWRWRTRIAPAADPEEVRAEFDQSTMAAMYVDPKELLKRSEFYVPRPNEEAEIDRFVLGSMDGEMVQGDIADELLERFPDRFSSFDAALDHVFELSIRYSR